MKNADIWQPSKFVRDGDAFVTSSDINEVALSSRLINDILAKKYSVIISEHAQGLLLDMGCGKVPCYQMYKDYVTGNVCVDWSQTAHKSPYLDHEMDLNKELMLDSEQFDTILATDVLEHIREPSLLWKEMARLLKPGGKIILATPFYYWLHEEPYDYYRYTEHALRGFCKDNGLEEIMLEAYGGFPEIISDLIAKQLRYRRMFLRIHMFISSILCRSFVGKRLSRKSKRIFPLGYCIVARKKT